MVIESLVLHSMSLIKGTFTVTCKMGAVLFIHIQKYNSFIKVFVWLKETRNSLYIQNSGHGTCYWSDVFVNNCDVTMLIQSFVLRTRNLIKKTSTVTCKMRTVLFIHVNVAVWIKETKHSLCM